MIAETQDLQNPAAQGKDEKPPYERLPAAFRKIVDSMVASRGKLLQGYHDAIEGAKQGRPVRGEHLDEIQQQYNDEFTRDQANLRSMLAAPVFIATHLSKLQGKLKTPTLKTEPSLLLEQSQDKGPIKEAVIEKELPLKRTEEDAPAQGQPPINESSPKTGIMEKGAPKATLQDKGGATPEASEGEVPKDNSADFGAMRDSPLMKSVRKIYEIGSDFQDALTEKTRDWDEDHVDVVQNVNIKTINKALMEQSRKDGKMPKENIKLAEETHDTAGLFKDLLSKNPGFAVTDVHIFDDSFAIVEKHMKTLKESGVDTIYIEHDPDWVRQVAGMSPEQLQKLKTEGKLGDVSIRNAEQNADNYHFHTSEDIYGGMLSMIEAAKKEGIRVVGMDEYPTPSPQGMGEWRRIAATNAVWVDNIQKDRESLPEEQKKSGKYVVIGGMLHFINGGIVDEQLGVPTVGFTKVSSPDQPEIQALRAPAMPDFLISNEGYINTRTLLRAQTYDELSKGLRNIPLPLGLSIMAKGGAIMAAEQARTEMKDMREEFERDRPPSSVPYGGQWHWRGDGIRYEGEVNPGTPLSPSATPVNPSLREKADINTVDQPLPEQKRDKIHIPPPVEIRDGDIKSQSLPSVPMRGDESKGKA